MTRKQRIIFILIFILAAVLRLLGAGTREIQYDDAFSIFLSQQNLSKIIQGTAADTMPPLYYFALHFWQNLGSDLFTLRLLGILISLAILFLGFDLARRLFGWPAGLWSALFIAVSPIQIYHAQDLRMYTLLVLGQVGYFWCFVRLIQDDHPAFILWVGMVLGGLMAMYSHNLAIFGLVIPNIYLVLKRNWLLLGQIVLAQLVIGLFSAPWLVMIPGQVEKIQTAFWTPRPGLIEAFQAIIQFTAHLPVKGLLLPLVAILSAQILILLVLETWRDRNKEPNLGFVVLIAFGLPILLFLVSYAIRPVFVARGFLVSSLAYYILIGRVVARRWRSGIGVFLAGFMILAVGVSLPSFYTFNKFPRSPYQEAMISLRQNRTPDDVILHDNKLSFFPSHYHAQDLNQVFLADEPGSFNDTYARASQEAIGLFPAADIESAVAGAERIFFVVISQAIEEYQESGQPHPVLAWLEEHYVETNHATYNDLEIFLFNP